MLISVAELETRLGDPQWLPVDCRFNLTQSEAGEQAYRVAHIPGAVYAHLDRDLSARRTENSGRHPLPEPARLVALFSAWGIGKGTQVIAYDDAGGAFAARLWWLLRWMGHARAGVLDGGLAAWCAAGLPLTPVVPARQAVPFTGTAGHMPTIDAQELERELSSPVLRLLDARSRARFHGCDETLDPVAGHIPGAISAPYQENLTAEGIFRTPEELRARFTALLRGSRAEAAVAMCGSGVTACHNLFAMELAGLTGARLYPGSWSEWIRSPGRPITTD